MDKGVNQQMQANASSHKGAPRTKVKHKNPLANAITQEEETMASQT